MATDGADPGVNRPSKAVGQKVAMGFVAPRGATQRGKTQVHNGNTRGGASPTTGSTSATKASSTRQRQMPMGANKNDFRHGKGSPKAC